MGQSQSIQRILTTAKHSKTVMLVDTRIPLDLVPDISNLSLESLHLIIACTSLTVVNLSGNGLVSITGSLSDAGIGSLTNLKVLDVSLNQLDYLPDDLMSLRLSEFNCSNNLLTLRSFPIGFFELDMREFNCSNNTLSDCTEQMQSFFQKLENVQLHGNPWANQLAQVTELHSVAEIKAILVSIASKPVAVVGEQRAPEERRSMLTDAKQQEAPSIPQRPALPAPASKEREKDQTEQIQEVTSITSRANKIAAAISRGDTQKQASPAPASRPTSQKPAVYSYSQNRRESGASSPASGNTPVLGVPTVDQSPLSVPRRPVGPKGRKAPSPAFLSNMATTTQDSPAGVQPQLQAQLQVQQQGQPPLHNVQKSTNLRYIHQLDSYADGSQTVRVHSPRKPIEDLPPSPAKSSSVEISERRAASPAPDMSPANIKRISSVKSNSAHDKFKELFGTTDNVYVLSSSKVLQSYVDAILTASANMPAPQLAPMNTKPSARPSILSPSNNKLRVSRKEPNPPAVKPISAAAKVRIEESLKANSKSSTKLFEDPLANANANVNVKQEQQQQQLPVPVPRKTTETAKSKGAESDKQDVARTTEPQKKQLPPRPNLEQRNSIEPKNAQEVKSVEEKKPIPPRPTIPGNATLPVHQLSQGSLSQQAGHASQSLQAQPQEEQAPPKPFSIKAKALAMQGSIPTEKNGPITVGSIRSRTQTNDEDKRAPASQSVQTPQLPMQPPQQSQQSQQPTQPIQPAQSLQQPIPLPAAIKPKYAMQSSETLPKPDQQNDQKDQKYLNQKDIPPWKKELEMRKNVQTSK